MKFFRGVVVFALFFLVACGGGGRGDDSSGISVKINQDSHELTITLEKDGTLVGFFSDSPLKIQDVKQVCFNSDYDGWEENANCSDISWDKKRVVHVALYNTSNKCVKGNWSVVDKQGNRFYADVENWKKRGIISEVIPAVVDDEKNIIGPFIRYGGEIKPLITVERNNTNNTVTMRIDFGINKFVWMSESFQQEEIESFSWQSQATGWLDENWSKGVLKKDEEGDWTVVIENLPLGSHLGNIEADLTGGRRAWGIPEVWNLGENIYLINDPGNPQVLLFMYCL